MSNETQIIQNDQKNTNIKNIFINNKKTTISFFIIILIFLFSYFFYTDYKKSIKIKISEQYNLSIIIS